MKGVKSVQKRGIDVSVWQGNLSLEDWTTVKNSGVEFAMIRCGYTSYGVNKGQYIDRYFENNYTKCKEIGLPVGTYYYSCATTEEEAIAEANYVLSLIKDKQFEYPIVIDTEDNHDTSNPMNASISQASIGKARLTPIIKTFCDIIEKEGYYVAIYASTSWFKNNLILDDLVEFDKWVAQWSNNAPSGIKYGMWQYSANGNVPGIGSGVDLDYAYKDYPELMKEFGFNNIPKDDPDPEPTPDPEPEPTPDPEPEPTPEPEVNCFKKFFTCVFTAIGNFIKKIFKRGA